MPRRCIAAGAGASEDQRGGRRGGVVPRLANHGCGAGRWRMLDTTLDGVGDGGTTAAAMAPQRAKQLQLGSQPLGCAG